MDEPGMSCKWTREQDKAFENALANFPEDDADRWAKIAAVVPGKTLGEIMRHYEVLVEDVYLIQSGYVPVPCYNSPPEGSRGKEGTNRERRRGVPWTEDEHRLFLIGLEKYGDGDWRSISRRCVVTRTPTQVASHAQKYKIRQKSMNQKKERRRRSSIHDVTLGKNRDIPGPQVPITGQASDSAASSAGQLALRVPPPPPAEMLAAATPAGMLAAAAPAEMYAAAPPAGIKTLDNPPPSPAGISTVKNLPAPPAEMLAAATPAGMLAAAAPAEMYAAAPPAGIKTLDNPPAPPAGISTVNNLPAPPAEMLAAAAPAGIRTVDNLPVPPAGIYAAPGSWQSVGAPVVSADSTTPVNHTASEHMAYGHAPVSGTSIQEAPMNFSVLKYLMQHTSSTRS